MKFMGIDPSFSGTGIVVVNKDGDVLFHKTIRTEAPTPPKGNKDPLFGLAKRIGLINEGVRIAKLLHPPYSTAIEAPSFGSKGNKAYQLGALHYAIRLHHPDSLEIVTPGQLKKFVTGSGSADKVRMAVAVLKRWKREFPNDNEVDAYGLAMWARDLWLKEPGRPEVRQTGLA